MVVLITITITIWDKKRQQSKQGLGGDLGRWCFISGRTPRLGAGRGVGEILRGASQLSDGQHDLQWLAPFQVFLSLYHRIRWDKCRVVTFL